MENLEIKKSAKELAEKVISNDIEHINKVLNELDSATLERGYTFIVIKSNEAVKMLRDKGFNVAVSSYSDDNCYKVSWLSTEEEQA